MTSDADQLAEAWATNCRINRLLLDNISEEGIDSTLSKRGGRGVAGEFAHMHNIRLAQLEGRAKHLAQGVPKLNPAEHPPKQQLLDAFDASDPAIAELLLAIADAKPKHRGFRKGIFTTLSYFIAHEAHHRGRILLTLKVSGHTLDRNTQMAVWAWDRL